MKTIITMLLISFLAIGQTTQRNTLYESKQGFKIAETIQDGSSSKYFVYSFKNEKYKHITDIGIIIIRDKNQLIDFANKLIKLSNIENKISLSFKNENYMINLYESINDIYIYDKKEKCFSITKAEAKNIGEEILLNINLLNYNSL